MTGHGTIEYPADEELKDLRYEVDELKKKVAYLEQVLENYGVI